MPRRRRLPRQMSPQVQGILKVANQFRIPLWPISRGKNFGYGGASPRMPGTVMLDLGRMNRIIEVNEAQGYCIVEPGVGFFDMRDHLQKNRIALQMGTPGNAWGSVMGNALERGFSPAGDHSNNICGLELVLANGEIVRTGMGAMGNGKAWPLFKHGFGPSWDQMIVQSNFAIVTKMCLWMKPEDEAAINIDIKLDKPDELEWFTKAVTPLRMRSVLDGLVRITSYQSSATVPTLRREWYTGPGSIPDDVIEQMKSKLNIGWWNGTLRLGGYSEVCEANLKIVQAQFAKFTKQEFPVKRTAGSVRAGPTTYPLQMTNWYGGRGGHIGFSPAMPADASAGAAAVRAHAQALPGVRARLFRHVLQRRAQRHQCEPDPLRQGRPGHEAPRAPAVHGAGLGREAAGLRGIPHASFATWTTWPPASISTTTPCARSMSG